MSDQHLYDQDSNGVVDALHALAASTEVDPLFAAKLESVLSERAAQLQRKQQIPLWRQRWWRRLLMQRTVRLPLLRLQQGLAIVLLAAVLIFATTPAARATLWGWLYAFGLIEETAITGQPIALEHVTPGTNRALDLKELQAQSPFPVTTPAWLPTTLIFTGGFIESDANGTQITLAYHQPPRQESYAPDAPLLFLLIADGTVENYPLLAQEHVVPVRLKQIVGMYAKGGWQSQESVTAETTTIDGLYWDSNLDEVWLSWQMDGRSYLLYAQGLAIQQEQMIAMATSMIDGLEQTNDSR